MTILKIIQGNEQIGGNIISIEGDKSRIILDFGIPLTEQDGSPNIKELLPNIQDLYKDNREKETVVFISHAHLDHFGLLRYINPSIPIYTTKFTKELIEKTSKLLYRNRYDMLNIIELSEPFENTEFCVEALYVNHSIAGSCAFKIADKSSGKTILYSGDLRSHGRSKNELSESCKNADYFILEGTTLSREEKETKTECYIEKEMAEVFSEDKMVLVCCSPLNIDRFVSVYNAAKKSDKILVIDPYTAFILDTFKDAGLPNYKSENIKVYCVGNSQTGNIFKNPYFMKFKHNKISFEDIMLSPEKFVIKENDKISRSILKRMNADDINIVYSYWEGYLCNENYRWGVNSGYMDKLKLIHTSGHIYKQDLIKLVNELTPRYIIPIHTLANSKFREIFGEKCMELGGNRVLNL